jgi:hypothetical protein
MVESSRRRTPFRWLTLAEIVGLAALALTGLGFWDSHRERLQEDRERAVADQQRAEEARARQAELAASALKLTFLVTGAVNDAADKVRLASVHPEQVIQTQTIWFPAAVRPDSVETTGNPRIEARWIVGGLGRAAGRAKRGRLPVGMLTDYVQDGQTRTDRSVYLLGYSLHGRLFGGPKLELEGLSLARRGLSGDLQPVTDQMWAASAKPAAAPSDAPPER